MLTVREFARSYDRFMLDARMQQVYASSGYFNVGYWSADVTDQPGACAELVRRVAGGRPLAGERWLDAGCGTGAPARWLQEAAPEASVIGINLSERQIREARWRAPGTHFAVMDAARTALRPESFDAVISIEAAFHFRTRVEFLREAWRLLRPGGRLRMADIVFADAGQLGEWMTPEENRVRTMEEYALQLMAAGFGAPRLKDVTASSWTPFCERQRAMAAGREGEFWERMLTETVRHYLLVEAEKPAASHSAAKATAEEGRSPGSTATQLHSREESARR